MLRSHNIVMLIRVNHRKKTRIITLQASTNDVLMIDKNCEVTRLERILEILNTNVVVVKGCKT